MPLGRPKDRWKNTIIIGLKDNAYAVGGYMYVARDRVL
jgi:hypothetical protein